MICPHCRQRIELEPELCARCQQELGESGYRWRRLPGVGALGKKGVRKRKVCPSCAEFLDRAKQGELFVADSRGQEVPPPERRAA